MKAFIALILVLTTLCVSGQEEIIDRFPTPCYSIDTTTKLSIYLNDTIKGLIAVECYIDTINLRLRFNKIFTIRLTDITNNRKFDFLDNNRTKEDSLYFHNTIVNLIYKTKKHIRSFKLVKSKYSDCEYSKRITFGFMINNK